MAQRKPKIWLIPGLLESELSRIGAEPVLWLNGKALGYSEFAGLELAEDGISPKPPYGQQLFSSGVISPYWTTVEATLERAFSSEYNIELWHYDWRYDVRDTGHDLGNQIVSQNSPLNPAVIVGHSLGGIVARFAWDRLMQTFGPGWISKVITIGTPHEGSFNMPWAFNSSNPTVQLITGYKVATFAARAAAKEVDAFESLMTPARMIDIMMSWPSVYYLMPHYPLSPTAEEVLMYDRIYNAETYPYYTNAKQERLDFARNVIQRQLRSRDLIPDPRKVGQIFGASFPTANAVEWGLLPGSDFRQVLGGDGDDTVLVHSASALDGRKASINCNHAGQPQNQEVADKLVQWIREDWLDPGPLEDSVSQLPSNSNGFTVVPFPPWCPWCRGG